MSISIIACVLLFTTTFCNCDETPKSDELQYALKTPATNFTNRNGYQNILTMTSKENGGLGGNGCTSKSCPKHYDCCEDDGDHAQCCSPLYHCYKKLSNGDWICHADGTMTIAPNTVMIFLSSLMFLGYLNASY